MASPQTSVLSLQGVALASRHGAAPPAVLDFELGHREAALLELDGDSETIRFVDLCLGLEQPQRGDIWCLGRAWRGQSYREMLKHRSRIGTLVGSLVWPANVPVASMTMTPQLYHTERPMDDTVEAATVLARHFGLPGLPTGRPEIVHPGDLARAACVRAFLGAPEFVVIADPALESMAELGVALAQAIGAVQARGGTVLWVVGSIECPAARFMPADHVLRLDDGGLHRARRPQ
jgi:phospholipid/cholesterol/gamma-HCH transport system ATP-binding protein